MNITIDSKEFNINEKEALTSAKLTELKKKINAQSWTDNMELLMKQWGEKAAGLRFMHRHSSNIWKQFSNRLSIIAIFTTLLASTLSLVSTSIDNNNINHILAFSVGGFGIISTLIQSLKKFYEADEKAANHNSTSKQFDSFYRYLVLQLGMSRDDRESIDILTSFVLKEYEKLQLEAPNLSTKSINTFKDQFKNSNQTFPDIVQNEYIITIYKENNKVDKSCSTQVTNEPSNENNLDKINKVNRSCSNNVTNESLNENKSDTLDENINSNEKDNTAKKF